MAEKKIVIGKPLSQHYDLTEVRNQGLVPLKSFQGDANLKVGIQSPHGLSFPFQAEFKNDDIEILGEPGKDMDPALTNLNETMKALKTDKKYSSKLPDLKEVE